MGVEYGLVMSNVQNTLEVSQISYVIFQFSYEILLVENSTDG
jgi:hypothetical protein